MPSLDGFQKKSYDANPGNASKIYWSAKGDALHHVNHRLKNLILKWTHLYLKLSDTHYAGKIVTSTTSSKVKPAAALKNAFFQMKARDF